VSLATNITNAITAIGTDIKALLSTRGTMSSLTTTVKTDLVSAINEVKASPSGAVIDDATASTTKVYSSTKTNNAIAAAVSGLVASSPAALDTLNELATALGNDANFATTVTTALGTKALASDVTTLTTNVGTTTTDFAAAYATAKA